MRWSSAAELRRGYNIIAYVGANGSGKTLTAVDDTIADLDAGRPVLSTVRFTDGSGPDGPSHPSWIPFRDWSQLLDFEGGTVVMDEVASVASSRESAGLPAEVVVFLQQLRKRRITLRWTAPAWPRADKIIREVTQLVVVAQGRMKRRVPGSAWRRSGMITLKHYDARQMDEFTLSAASSARVPNLGFSFRLTDAIEGRNFYDSESFVEQLGDVDASGRCTVCGGKRQVPRCRCGEGRAQSGGSLRARRAAA